MKNKTTTGAAGHPADVDDRLTEVLRSGAQRLFVQAIEAEAEAFLALMTDWKLEDGRARFVRHGHGPERSIQTSVIGRLKGKWDAEHLAWQERDLTGQRYVYMGADGVYLQARMGETMSAIGPSPWSNPGRMHAGDHRRDTRRQ